MCMYISTPPQNSTLFLIQKLERQAIPPRIIHSYHHAFSYLYYATYYLLELDYIRRRQTTTILIEIGGQVVFLAILIVHVNQLNHLLLWNLI